MGSARGPRWGLRACHGPPCPPWEILDPSLNRVLDYYNNPVMSESEHKQACVMCHRP